MTNDTTAQTPNLVQKLIAAKKAIGAVGKNDTNAQQGFKFRGIDAVLNAVSGPLNDQGILTYATETVSVKEATATTRSGNVMNTATVIVRYAFTDGTDTIEFSAPGQAFDSGDKAMAKAMSVAYRTALIQALQLPTDDPDPDHDSYDAQPTQRPTNPARTEQIQQLMAVGAQIDLDPIMMRCINRMATPNDVTADEADTILATDEARKTLASIKQ